MAAQGTHALRTVVGSRAFEAVEHGLCVPRVRRRREMPKRVAQVEVSLRVRLTRAVYGHFTRGGKFGVF